MDKRSFKKQYNKEERIQKCSIKLSNYPEMIPLVVEKNPRSALPDLPKNQFLVTKDFTLSQLRSMMRKSISINEKKNVFFYIGNQIVPDDRNMYELYEKSKDEEDGFLYIVYSDLDVFGGQAQA